jgi:hypothetical protein
MENDRRGQYIKFRLQGTTQRVTLDQLRPHVDKPAYRGEITRKDVFEKISERGVGRHEEFKSKLIIHPVLHCIQKIMGHMIYVRVESIVWVIHEDLQLIDTMLLQTMRYSG